MNQLQKELAYYLKYRPQTLDDLIGQDSVKKILQGALKENRLSHAYLFVGPRGTGKTSTARILAKMVNCEAKDGVPCNSCTMCLTITDGSNLDLIEIDAASNRGVEDIRILREKIKLSPTQAKKKVYLIDEVHMLTTEAFNALLKTLEEPPSHALFILATTDVNKLPQTILSRVQRLDFRLATPLEIIEVFKKIVSLEKIDIEEEALKLLAKKADGSFRDGIKLLDQISSTGEKITLESLQKSLKALDFDIILEILDFFIKRDAASGLLVVSKYVEQGIEVKELILSLMDVLRSLVFIKHGVGENLVQPSYSLEKYQLLEEKGGKFDISELTFDLEVLQNSLEKLKTSSIVSLPLELAIVEICSQRKDQKVIQSTINRQPDKVEEKPIESIATMPNLTVTSTITSESGDIVALKEKWTYVCETIRPYNFSLEALLRSTSIASCSETTLVMEVPYSFHQRILETPKNKDLLESILSEILGRSIKVSTVLGNRPPKREDIENIEVAADDEIIKAAVEIFNS